MGKAVTFPLRVTEDFMKEVEKSLLTSVEKSKHAFILKAVEEKIDRERKV